MLMKTKTAQTTKNDDPVMNVLILSSTATPKPNFCGGDKRKITTCNTLLRVLISLTIRWYDLDNFSFGGRIKSSF